MQIRSNLPAISTFCIDASGRTARQLLYFTSLGNSIHSHGWYEKISYDNSDNTEPESKQASGDFKFPHRSGVIFWVKL
jgi:hypothetical protein